MIKIMSYPREISSLPLSLSQKKSLTEKGFQLVSEIKEISSDLKINVDELTKAPETKTGLQLLEEEKECRQIFSFLDNLDDLLNGVLRPGSITELVGLPGSGRTQICLHLSVSAQVENCTLSGRTVYICTNSDFSISRLKEITRNYISKVECFKNFKEIEILKNINFVNIMSTEELSACMDYLNEFGSTENIILVIIDSITYPFRLCESREKSSLLQTFVTELRNLAKSLKFSVVLTNDMTTIVGSNGNEVVPSLRDTFYHLVNNRILLSKTADIFQAELMKCSTKFAMKCDFKLLDDIT